MTRRTVDSLKVSAVWGCVLSLGLWAVACAGPDSTAGGADAGVGEGGDEGPEALAPIICNCPDPSKPMADAGVDGEDEGGGDAEAGAAATQEGGGDGSGGPELSLLAGGLGGPGNADGVGREARFYLPTEMAADNAGNVYVADQGNSTIRRIALSTGIVSTIAGSAGTQGATDGVGSRATFRLPSGIAIDGSVNLYVADTYNSTIRKVVLATGATTTVAGAAGMPGSADGTLGSALFNNPSAIATDKAGNLYACDTGNSTIRKVILATGAVSTIAGTAGTSGTTDATGAAARFNAPRGLALDGFGDLYVSDSGNCTIRQLVLATGVVTTVAGSPGTCGSNDGTGAAARFNDPRALSTDAAGNLYVADWGDSTIRQMVLATGAVTTLAGSAGMGGTDDGIGANARFSRVSGITSDGMGNVYAADSLNCTIRQIGLATSAVATLAGSAPMPGSNDGVQAAARFIGPTALAADRAGNLYVADPTTVTIRKVFPSTGTVRTLAGATNVPGSADGTGAAATFNAPLGAAIFGPDLYIADSNNGIIRKIVMASGSVTTVAGSAGMRGSVDGTGPAARFDSPYALAADGLGNLYVADFDNTIRQIVLVSTTVTTLAGSAGTQGSTDGIGTAARFSSPGGLAADGVGNLYVADKGAHAIRKVIVATRMVSTVAGFAGVPGSTDGLGADVRFNSPTALTLDGAGNLYVADSGNGTIRKMDLQSGRVTTWLGVPGRLGVRLGPLPAGLNSPQGLVAISATELAIADSAENAILLAH
jgi:sugar lactone lactonase YvrE